MIDSSLGIQTKVEDGNTQLLSMLNLQHKSCYFILNLSIDLNNQTDMSNYTARLIKVPLHKQSFNLLKIYRIWTQNDGVQNPLMDTSAL